MASASASERPDQPRHQGGDANELSDDAIAQLETRARERCARLLAQDPELQRAAPDHDAIEKIRSCRTMIDAFAMASALYADRPCLGHRAFTLEPGGAAGRATVRYLPELRTISYAELWARAEALASGLTHGGLARTGTFVGIYGLGSADWVAASVACLYLAAVSVPLQTTMSPGDLQHVINEAELGCIVCSVEQIEPLASILPRCPTVRGVVVMDLRGGEPAEREALSAWRGELASGRGAGFTLCSMRELEHLGRARGIVRRVVPAELPDPDPLLTIMYTSGSTGTPKGAMFPESVWRTRWQDRMRLPELPAVILDYLPLNHLAGSGHAIQTLLRGGVVYFAAESDMSTLFEDIRLARPTEILLVPRVSEMIHDHFQAEVVKRSASLARSDDEGRRRVEAEVMAEMRASFLGDRLLGVIVGSAPTPEAIQSFLKRCFEVPVYDGYGSTEAGVITINGHVIESVLRFELVDRPDLGYRTTDAPWPRGELHVKTNALIPGYYKNGDATRDLFDDEGLLITGDIMEQRGPDRLFWIDRAKNVLKLSQGEFVATSRLEGTFVAQSRFVHQIYLHGSGLRSYLLAVVVPDMRAMEPHLRQRGLPPTEAHMKQLLRDELNRVATESGLHGYEVPRDFVIEPAPFTRKNGLLTESEKPARQRLRDRYGARLEALYDTIERTQRAELAKLARRREGAAPAAEAVTSAAETVKKAVEVTLGLGDVDVSRSEQSFIQLGGDSLAAVRLGSLVKDLSGVSVPVGLLLDPTRSVRSIVEHIEGAIAGAAGRREATFDEVHGAGAAVVRAADLRLDRFLGAGELAAAARAPRALQPEPRAVLLTGANGFLGRFLLLSLLERLPAEGGAVHCVVRAPSDPVAAERLRGAYCTDPALEADFRRLSTGGRLVVHAGDLMKPRLGLSGDVYDRLCDEVDTVIHNGALVNHTFSYQQLFEPNVLGTVEIIRFAVARRLKPVGYVSTIGAVAGLDREEPIREDEDIRALWPERPTSDGYAAGYSTSKWASEILLRDAHDRLGVPVNVFRPSAILAHRRYRGQINVPDWFTRLLCGIVYTGIAPRSFYAGERGTGHLDGLPVDVVARSIVAIGLDRPSGELANFHVVNPHVDDSVSLDVVVDWVRSAGFPVQRVDDHGAWYRLFRDRLSALDEPRQQRSTLPIVHQWARPARVEPGDVLDARRLLERLRRISGAQGEENLAALPHLDEGFIHKYLSDMVALRLLDPPVLWMTGS